MPSVTMTDNVILTAGRTGSVAFGEIDNRFHAPEPVSAAPIGSGLAALRFLARRNRA
jgi:hypothetical protein